MSENKTATPSPMQAICADLRAEYDALDRLVADLTVDQWNQATPFYKWSIYDEIAHIYYFDSTSQLATSSREEFAVHAPAMRVELVENDSFTDIINSRMGILEPADLLAKWRTVRNQLLDNLSSLGPKDRLPWYGPDMSALSFATARLMESWAHGQDVFDTLRVRRRSSDSIKSIAHLGVTTFAWSFINRKLPVPENPPSVSLVAPSGAIWQWGEENAENYVKGSAEDFCLLVTQRRNLADTGLEVVGESAEKWLSMAQCFAGPAADGPVPGQRHW
jgi:uncharacterized protein (TIGR03084 family)